jgi:hypothetical protein
MIKYWSYRYYSSLCFKTLKQLLVTSKADSNKTTVLETTALEIATARGHILVETYLEKRTNLGAKDRGTGFVSMISSSNDVPLNDFDSFLYFMHE